MTQCTSCSASLTTGAKFCRTCGAPASTSESAQRASSLTTTPSPRLHRLGLILLVLAAVTYLAEPVSHVFTKMSCALSDGSSYDCGSGAVGNTHAMSAALMLVAALCAFAADRWLRTPSASPSDALRPSMTRQKYAVYFTIAALVGSSWLLGQAETHHAQWDTDVGRMATFLERATIPGLRGEIEQFDSGERHYSATAPLRNSDITAMCRKFLSAVARINSSHRQHPVRPEADALTECKQQFSVVRRPVPDGNLYLESSYVVHGSYRTSSGHRDVAFLAELGLSSVSDSGPTDPFPKGYQWSLSLRAE